MPPCTKLKPPIKYVLVTVLSSTHQLNHLAKEGLLLYYFKFHLLHDLKYYKT